VCCRLAVPLGAAGQRILMSDSDTGDLAKAKEHLSALQSGSGREHVRAVIDCLTALGGTSAAIPATPSGEVYEALIKWVASDIQLLNSNQKPKYDLLELELALSDTDLIVATWRERRLQREPIRQAMRKQIPSTLRLHLEKKTRALHLKVIDREFGESNPSYECSKRNERYILAMIQLVEVTLASGPLLVQQVQTLKDFVRKNSALTSASYATKAEVAICNQVRKAWEVKTQQMSDELDMVALGNNNNNNNNYYY
jgi:hypothetical protein